MFQLGQVGQAVKVVAKTKDDMEELKFLMMLPVGKVFHVLEYQSPEECAKMFPGKKYWVENGGRVVLRELPKLEYFGRRFEVVAE